MHTLFFPSFHEKSCRIVLELVMLNRYNSHIVNKNCTPLVIDSFAKIISGMRCTSFLEVLVSVFFPLLVGFCGQIGSIKKTANCQFMFTLWKLKVFACTTIKVSLYHER